jgi:hypothetical protein
MCCGRGPGDRLTAGFTDPEQKSGSMTLYWLNGPINKDSLKHHIRMLRQEGFSGVAPLPLSRLKPAVEPAYLSEDYLEMYGFMLDELAANGMELVLYDDCDYPSGTAGGRLAKEYPQYMAKYLARIDTIFTGGGVRNILIPKGTLMSACLSESGSTEFRAVTGSVTITDKDGEKAVASIGIPEGNWRLQLFICVVDPRHIRVDGLDPQALGKFVEMTYDQYYKRFPQHFGTTIRTTFFDDPAYWHVPGAREWTPGYNEKFRAVYGYAPDTLYPSLFEDTGENTAAARVSMFSVRDQLNAEGYPGVLSKWAAAHRVECSGHPANTYRPNPVQNMGDVIRYFKYQDVPLCDYIHFFRHGVDGFVVPSSAAYNYDKGVLICEIYGNFQPDDYNDDDMLYRAGMDVYARGINKLLPHGTWHDASNVRIIPEISWRNPKMASGLKHYNDWVSRCEMILQNSRHVAEIGILYPIADLQARYNFTDYQVTNGREPVRGNDYYNFLGMMTTKVRTDYTLIHPEVLNEKCIVKANGVLRLDNQNNYEEYRILILPWCNTIYAANLDKVAEFASRGGIVLFAGSIPQRSAEPDMDSLVQAKITEIMSRGKAYYIENPDPEKMKDFLATHLPDPVIEVKNVTVAGQVDDTHQSWPESFRNTDYAYNYIHKVKEGKDFFFFGNPTDYDLTAEISFVKTLGLKPKLWDPHTGAIKELACRIEHGRIWVTLPLERVSSRFVVFEE